MSYKSFLSYVQKQIDKLLRSYKRFVKAYVDNIIIFSRTLEEHMMYLRTIFQLFRDKRVSLALTKSFSTYLSIILLEQRVNSLSISTFAKKIAIITSLRFFHSLRNLKVFLKMTD